MKARYVHTNLIARDWESLARFYVDVFGCSPVPPQRDYQGANLESATGLIGVRLQGMHLRLPGYGPKGPTLEIFQYTPGEAAEASAINRPGFAHLAFGVSDVEEAQREVLAAGGSSLGEVTEFQTQDGGTVKMVYLRDPEGNIIEVQTWTRSE